MGKYDALLAEAGVDDDVGSKYGDLLAEAGEVEETELPLPEEKKGYFSGINKAMDDKAMEYAQKNLKPERYPLQHAVQKFNSIVDIPLSGLSKAAEPITKNPTVKKVTDAFGGAAMEMAEGPLLVLQDAGFKGATKENVLKGLSKANEKYPVLGEVGQLAGNVVGLGGAGKITATLGKEAAKLPSKAGSGLVDAGKNFKLGDLKIKDTIAKKGYGKDLIEKKQNIANTIYEYGLSEGNHQAGAAKASQLLDDIFTKTDEIVTTISKDPAAPKKNPLRAMTDDLNLDALVDIDEEESAQKFVNSLAEKFREKGFDQDLTIDKLVEAKRMLDKKGTLFKSGAPISAEDQLKVAIKKKMYLNLVNQIAEVSPELKALNTEAKKLFSAQDALSGAASRTANKDAISLTDWIMGASAVIDPKAIPALVLKKGLANGRGSNLMLNTGRVLKGDKSKTIDDILNSVKKDVSIEKNTNVDLPMGYTLPTFYRKGVPVIERDGRLVSKREDYTRADWPRGEPTIRDRLDVWDIKGNPMEGVKGDKTLNVEPTVKDRMDIWDIKSRPMEGAQGTENINITPEQVRKFKEDIEDLLTLKKKAYLGTK